MKKVEEKSLVPAALRNNIGKMLIAKGCSDDGLLRLYQWDAIDRCNGESCPGYNKCTAATKGHGDCAVQLSYVSSVLDMVFRNYEEYITEPLLFHIGMHMLPLYKGLCKLLIAEMGVDSVVYATPKGTILVSPIYKEMRELIKALNWQWAALKLPVLATDVPDLGGFKPSEK